MERGDNLASGGSSCPLQLSGHTEGALTAVMSLLCIAQVGPTPVSISFCVIATSWGLQPVQAEQRCGGHFGAATEPV
jgi:hypothetical protein